MKYLIGLLLFSSTVFATNSAYFQGGDLKFKGGTSGTLSVKAKAAAGTYDLTLPSALGSPGDCLTDAAGDGVLSFASCGGGGVLKTDGTNSMETGTALNWRSSDNAADLPLIRWYDSAVTNNSLVFRSAFADYTDPNSYGAYFAMGAGNIYVDTVSPSGLYQMYSDFVEFRASNGDTSVAPIVKFYDDSGFARYVSLKAPTLGASVNFTLPGADGSSGDCLKTNASGVLSFSGCVPSTILLGDGSVSAPSHSFTNDTNSGMYLVAANNLAFAVDGVQALNCKKSTSAYGNCGFGVAASTSDNFPLILQRSINGGGVFLAVENLNTGTNSKSCISLISNNNNDSGEICMGAPGSVDILDEALRIRVTGNGKGIFYDAGALSTGFHEFRVGGDPLSTGTAVKINANKSTTFYSHPILQIQGAGSTPTCSSTFQGAIALTNGLIMCVCNGAGATWKKVSDGTTTCTF